VAALALGQHKAAEGYDALVKMTLEDEDAYDAVRAYALGLLGDVKAICWYWKGVQDKEKPCQTRTPRQRSQC
jgi:HEAT repeat protein